MTPLEIPTPTRGPTARLQLNDPPTLIMVATWVGEAVKAVVDTQHPGGTAGQVLAGLAAIAVTVVVLASKHNLAGKLAAIVPPVEQIAGLVADQFALAGIPQVRAELDALRGRVDAIPVDQRQALLSALAGLAGLAPGQPGAQAAPVPLQPV